MIKKIFGILLAVVLALALMASCGGGTTTPATTSTTRTTSTAPTTSTKPPTSTPVTGAPTSTTPSQTTGSTLPSTTTRPTTSTQPVTTTAAATTTTRPPTSTASVPPSSAGIDLQAILGLAGNIPAAKYDMVVTSPDTPLMTTTHVWLEGKKMRMEFSDDGDTVVIIMDSAARTYLMYTLPDKVGFSMAFQEQESALDKSGKIMGYSPKIIGTETLDGKLCTVIEYSNTEKGSLVTTKTWIWNQYGFPIKMEITSSSGKTTMLYQNIVIGDIDDAMFKVPADVMIMSGFPTGIPAF